MGDGRGDFQRAWQEFAGALFDGESILDAGAGIGRSRERLARGGRNRVTLQDVDRALMPYVDIVRDLRDVEGAWTVVTAFDVIEHVPDARAFLRQAWRLSTRGVLFTTPAHRLYPHPWHFTPTEILAIASEVAPAFVHHFARYKSGAFDEVRRVSADAFLGDETIYAHGLWIGRVSLETP